MVLFATDMNFHCSLNLWHRIIVSAPVFSTPDVVSLNRSGVYDSNLERSLVGVTPRPEVRDQISDVDSSYIGRDYDTKYSKSIDSTLISREEEFLQPAGSYTRVQVEVSLSDHTELVDWMAEVVYTQNLQIDVLYLAVHIMDCVLKLKPMKRKSFQLLGSACLFLSSKLEEVQVKLPLNCSRRDAS